MKASTIGSLTLILLLGAAPTAVAQTSSEGARQVAVPYPTAETPKAIDRGELSAQPGSAPISVTIALNLSNLSEAESLMTSLHTPGDSQYHRFLTADQFVTRFAPSSAEVARVVIALANYGLSATRTSATTLKATGLPGDMERAFGVSLHSYEVPAHDNAPAYTYHAPLGLATIPTEISGSVVAVVGLDTRPTFSPLSRSAFRQRANPSAVTPRAGLIDPFEYLTVADFASYYDVDPLYKQGVTGSGRTLGIVTLASFTPSDAFAYWSAIKLAVNPNRLGILNIDGGPGAPSDASGSVETTLDVEQSGGVAPGANIIVYQAPNTHQGWLDAFAAAIESNTVDSLSTSWGNWEWFLSPQNAQVSDPTTGQTAGFTQAAHQLFLRAAIQGQTLFAASLDFGAYMVNGRLGCIPSSSPSCNLTLSVDYPASDPAITAAGGTTLPGIQELCLNASCTSLYVINIQHERVWGWDYLTGFCQALGFDPFACGIFPIGSGGGVSILFDTPAYQSSLLGVQVSQPEQNFIYGGQLLYALPSYFPGRNVPDISFNADPQTGYIVFYTSEPSGVFEEIPGYGGTSFVAPQLNGVTALLGEYLHGSRLGLLNYPLYDLAAVSQPLSGPSPAVHAIAFGDNWFYKGRNGYNPAAGLGTLDVWNFAEILKTQ